MKSMVIFGKKDLDWKLRIENDFRYTKDVMTRKNNIAYTNIRCQAVANEVRKRLNKKIYELGGILICTVYKKDEEDI